jgi:hypothetical protein
MDLTINQINSILQNINQIDPQERAAVLDALKQAQEQQEKQEQAGDSFGKADSNSKVGQQAVVGGPNAKTHQLGFGDEEGEGSLTQTQKEMDAAVLKLLEGLIGNGQGIQGDDSGVSGIDPRLIDQLNSLDSGVGNLGSPNLDDFIRRLKQTKLDQIENRDWINYLAANNSSIHDSIKLSASAR